MQDFRYDPGSLRDHAARLVAQSEDVVRNFVVMGATTGLFIALTATAGNFVAGTVCGILGAAAGLVIGDDRKRGMLRDADVALCLVQVEENTRMRDSRGNLVSLATPKERLQKTIPAPAPELQPIRQPPAAPLESAASAEISAVRRAAPPAAAEVTSPVRVTKPAPAPAAPSPYQVIEDENGIPHYAAATETSQVQPAWLAQSAVIGAEKAKDEERPAYAAEWPVEEPARQSVEEHVVAPVDAVPAYAADPGYAEPLTASDDLSRSTFAPEEIAAPSTNVPRPASMDPEESGLSESEVRGVHSAHDSSFGPSFGSSMWVPDDEEDVEAV